MYLYDESQGYKTAPLTLLLSLLHMVFETSLSYHTYGGTEFLLGQNHSFRSRRDLRHHLVFLKGSATGIWLVEAGHATPLQCTGWHHHRE